MSNDIAIKVEDVKKDFQLPHHKNNSIKQSIVKVFEKKDTEVDTFHALRGISFEIKKGEFFGILGRNGSGKSTLLKIISEIYTPTHGSVSHEGTLVSFIELGVGFKAELTGRENVYLNGAMLGFSKKEIDERYDEIVEFAELENFMDQKIKNYSSGMKVRLAFAVAIQAKSDILVLDEVLAVGDASFQQKCFDYFKSLKDDKSKTIVFVTHSMSAVREYCDKAILIENGTIQHEGDASEIADEYMRLFDRPNKSTDDESHVNDKLRKVTINTRYTEEWVYIDLSMKATENLKDPVVALLIKKDGKQVYRWVSDENIKEKIELNEKNAFKATLKLQNIFSVGKHTVDVNVKDVNRENVYGVYDDVASFQVINHSSYRHKVLWRPQEEFTISK